MTMIKCCPIIMFHKRCVKRHFVMMYSALLALMCIKYIKVLFLLRFWQFGMCTKILAPSSRLKCGQLENLQQGCTKCSPYKKFLLPATILKAIVFNKILVQNADVTFSGMVICLGQLNPQNTALADCQDFTVKCGPNRKHFGHL